MLVADPQGTRGTTLRTMCAHEDRVLGFGVSFQVSVLAFKFGCGFRIRVEVWGLRVLGLGMQGLGFRVAVREEHGGVAHSASRHKTKP